MGRPAGPLGQRDGGEGPAADRRRQKPERHAGAAIYDRLLRQLADAVNNELARCWRWAFAAVLLAGLQLPLAVTVAVAGLLCGLAFVRVTPALVAPDEYTHLAAAYELASRLGGEQPADADGNLLVRECDAPYFGTRTGEIGILAYKAEALAIEQEPGGPDELTAASTAKAGQGSGNYLPQALGLRLARSSGAGFYVMLRQARIFNLVFYLTLTVLAVALAPAVRGLLACVALLPMPLQLAASLARCVGAGHGVLLHGALPAAAPEAGCVVGKNPAHCARRGGRPGQGNLSAGCVALLHYPGGKSRWADGICQRGCSGQGCVPAADPGGRPHTGGLPVDLRQRANWSTLPRYKLLLCSPSASWRWPLRSGWCFGCMTKYTPTQKSCASSAAAWAARWCWLSSAGVCPFRMGGGLEPDQLLMTNPTAIPSGPSLGYICRNLPATTKLLLRTIPECTLAAGYPGHDAG